MAKKGRKAGVAIGTTRRSIEQEFERVYDEMFSQQTDTLSAAIVEAYRNCKLCGYDELVMSGEIISQGRYWHGL